MKFLSISSGFVIVIALFLFVAAATTPFKEPPKTIDLYLTNEVTFDSSSVLIKGFIEAPNDSVINLYINSPGGLVMGENAIEGAIKIFKKKGGYLKVHILSSASSAAAMISCYGNEISYSPGAYRMFHTMAMSNGFSNIKITKDYKKPYILQLMFEEQRQKLRYCGLSSHDIDQVESGVEVYVFANGKRVYVP